MSDRAKQLIGVVAVALCVAALIAWNDAKVRADGGRYDAGGIWRGR